MMTFQKMSSYEPTDADDVMRCIREMCSGTEDIRNANPDAFAHPKYDEEYCRFMSRDTNGVPDIW